MKLVDFQHAIRPLFLNLERFCSLRNILVLSEDHFFVTAREKPFDVSWIETKEVAKTLHI